jgi:hypothetical protein
MNTELSKFAARLRGLIEQHHSLSGDQPLQQQFDQLAVELFALQFEYNPAFQKICVARNLTPQNMEHWTQIPAVPTSAFKELELTSIPPAERTAVFHSSGTTEQKPSRHFHCAESLAVYETSLWNWFASCVAGDLKSEISNFKFLALTPPPEQVPHSSLVHMFEVLRQEFGAEKSAFAGTLAADGAWTIDFEAVMETLAPRRQTPDARPVFIFGTAFSFVHLLDYLAENNLHLTLPAGSRVLETGGYKNRSRSLPKDELHALITEQLGVTRETILCEYGMSELSSQAYEVTSDEWRVTSGAATARHSSLATRHFSFPPWARVQIISPETGREVADGETGLIRIFDLANVFSIAAIQTEDLGIRRGDGFELLGRAQLAEPRGCSLMAGEFNPRISRMDANEKSGFAPVRGISG